MEELLEISFLTDDMKEKYLKWKVVEMFKVVKQNKDIKPVQSSIYFVNIKKA
jgi:hypothetical protein